MKHFLDIPLLAAHDLRVILDNAHRLKRERGWEGAPLAGKKLAMIFDKPSTRTRVSFEVGMLELGGHALYLSGKDMQLGRGESIADTARVLSRYVDILLLRCHDHAMLLELAEWASVPVINGLTRLSHPCQILADIMTFEERAGSITGKKVAWLGDGNNVCNSFIGAAARFGFRLAVACPGTSLPDAAVLQWSRAQGGQVTLAQSPQEAARDAHLVVTDTWVSMGEQKKDCEKSLAPYRVDEAIMALADESALFMHCLPAHRGEEVYSSVIDGPQSVVWEEAENRLHVQKAVMLWCLNT